MHEAEDFLIYHPSGETVVIRRVLEELGDVIVTAAVMARNLGGSWAVVTRESASKIGRRVPKANLYMSRPWAEAWAKAKEDVG